MNVRKQPRQVYPSLAVDLKVEGIHMNYIVRFSAEG